MALKTLPWTPTRLLQPVMNSQCFKSIVHSRYSNLLAEISLEKSSAFYQKRLCNSYSNDQTRTLGTFLGRASLPLPIDMLQQLVWISQKPGRSFFCTIFSIMIRIAPHLVRIRYGYGADPDPLRELFFDAYRTCRYNRDYNTRYNR